MNDLTEAAAGGVTSKTCDHCGKESLRPQIARSAFWHGDRLVVVEDIPALVCEECHEQYYDDETVMLIDRLRGEGFPPDRASGEIVARVFKLDAGIAGAAGKRGR